MTTTKQTLKAGTRIELFGTPAMGGFPAVPAEHATIARWSKVSGPVNRLREDSEARWHIVKFSNGGKLCVHESRFRVIDNRRAA